jgi:hypothetical protein
MKKFLGLKVINAKPMNRLDYNIFRGWDLPEDEDGTDEGMLVEYVDGGKANTEDFSGYVSWSPIDVFKNAYREIDGMTFGAAVENIKRGKKIARAGWNGRGMFVYYVPGGDFKSMTDVAKSLGDTVHYNPYMAIKNVNGTVSTWVPSVNDVLSEDWCVVE